MTTRRDDIFADYFSWLIGIVGDGGGRMDVLTALYNTDFYVDPKLPDDQNRVEDAIDLRDFFINEWLRGNISRGHEGGCRDEISYDFIHMKVTVLEVFVAVAIRCEEEVMQDEAAGNRTGTWFWGLLEWFEIALNGGHFLGRDKNLSNFLERRPFFDGERRRKRRSIWAEMCNFLNKMG